VTVGVPGGQLQPLTRTLRRGTPGHLSAGGPMRGMGAMSDDQFLDHLPTRLPA
jgi:hypothetical protein